MAQEKLVKIKLKDIRSNPNRDLEFNPFNEEKIAALISSIEETGFWTNVIVRPDPKDKGKYQQAYGHHRMEAARRCKVTEAEFVVRDLDDQTMLKMMELENQEDYRYSPVSLLESVKAVVKALAEGSIAPFHKAEERPHRPNEARYAPCFVPGKNDSLLRWYTALDVARYLGRTCTDRLNKTVVASPNVNTALDTLYLLEVKEITMRDIKDKNWATLSKDVAQAKRNREQRIANAKAVAKATTELQEKRKKLEDDSKAQAKKNEEERKKIREQQAAAVIKEEKEKQAALKARQKELDEEDKKRELKRSVEAKALDDKLKIIAKETEEKAQKDRQATALRKQVDAFLFKMEAMIDIKGALQEEINLLHRKVMDTTQRMRIRNAISAASTFLDEQSVRFFGQPPKQTGGDVLKEAQQREEARRKQNKEN